MATKITGTNTAAAPGVTGDDTDTGLFYGTNIIGFSTGGTEKLRVDANGLIANGGLLPSNYGSPNLLISGADSTLTLMGTGSTNSTSFTGIKFRVAGSSAGDYTKAGIFSRREGGYNDLSLIFALDTAADATSVSISDERMRITSAGRLQIGLSGKTGGDDQALVVNNPVTDNKVLELSTGNATGRINFSRTLSNTLNTTSYIEWGEPGAQGTGDLKFGTSAGSNNPTERLRITSGGNVGIGGTPTSGLLHVHGTIKCNQISILSVNAFETSTNVFEGKGTNGARLRSALSDQSTPSFSNQSDTDTGMFLPGSNVVGFTTGGIEKVRILNSGDVLIGLTSSPSGNGTNLWVSDGTVARLGIEKTGTGACKTTIGAGSDRAFNIYNETADHEIMRGETDGDVKITTGNLVIGTAGKGIDFTAQTPTQTSGSANTGEILDHYEEGSFTPKAWSGGSEITLSYHNNHGRYTRVGNMVTLWMWVRSSGTTTNTGGMQIGGLPFTSASDSYRPALCGRAYGLANFSSKSGVVFWMNGAENYLQVVALNSNGLAEANNLSNNVWTNGAELHCTFSYFV